MIIKSTFHYESKLQPLPIPKLKSTKQKLIDWIEPLVTKDELQQSIKVIEQFFQRKGSAEKLQAKLKQWKKSQNGNWLTPFWDDLYLKSRHSLPLTANFNILLKTAPYIKNKTTAQLAGQISLLIAEFYHKIIDEQIEPDYFRGQPLAMNQLNNIFCSMRVPQVGRDKFQIAPFNKKNNYIIFLYKNNFYKVPVTNNEGNFYNISNLIAAIEQCLQKEQTDSVNVGLYTVADRDRAAEIYADLNKSKTNQRILTTIANCLAIISVDEKSETATEAIKNLMLSPENKFFDKTVQIVITKSRQIGFNVEHSSLDGTSFAKVVTYIDQGLQSPLIKTKKQSTEIIPEKQIWDLTKEIKAKLAEINREYCQRAQNYALISNTFSQFGAEKIKQNRLSPDAFFQMALQIAQYRTYGKFNSVYEPVTVRFFREGRTECARATSIEKCNLVKALESGQYTKKRLYELMQLASNAHSKRIKQCQQGLGIERHLLGLERMFALFGTELEIEEKPAIFEDEGYKRLCYDFISTSGVAYTNAQYRMFAPTVRDGHGVAYFLRENSISINISSFATNEAKGIELMNHLSNGLQELQAIAKECS